MLRPSCVAGSGGPLPASPAAPARVEVRTEQPGGGRGKRSAGGGGRRCSLALVADTVFHQEVGGGDLATTVLSMLYHVSSPAVPEIVYSVRWTGDGGKLRVDRQGF